MKFLEFGDFIRFYFRFCYLLNGYDIPMLKLLFVIIRPHYQMSFKLGSLIDSGHLIYF